MFSICPETTFSRRLKHGPLSSQAGSDLTVMETDKAIGDGPSLNVRSFRTCHDFRYVHKRPGPRGSCNLYDLFCVLCLWPALLYTSCTIGGLLRPTLRCHWLASLLLGKSQRRLDVHAKSLDYEATTETAAYAAAAVGAAVAVQRRGPILYPSSRRPISDPADKNWSFISYVRKFGTIKPPGPLTA